MSCVCDLKGELNPEKNVGLNEYLREIKFCTVQESVDVVQRKKIFNDKNHYTYLLTLKIVSSREDGSSYRRYLCYVSIYENSFERTPRDQRLARQSAFSGLQ